MGQEKDKLFLEYDKQIWTIFSIGVISSVVLLYYAIYQLSSNEKIYAIILGFTVLVYSFFAVLGYGYKKKILFGDTENATKLDKEFYPRTRWIGEAVLILIGIFYFIYFLNEWLILTTIFLIELFACLIANLIRLKTKSQ